MALAAVYGGAARAVWRAVRLAPAEALRPPMPERFVRSWFDQLNLRRLLGMSFQIVAREVRRRPARAVLSSMAIAASTGLSVVGGWYSDAIDQLLELQFQQVMREDVSVLLTDPRPERALRELAHIPGVQLAEGLRMVPVRFFAGHRTRDGALQGVSRDGQLRQLRDKLGRKVALPEEGVVLSDVLADRLDVGMGDWVGVEVREGDRRKRHVRVAGLVADSFGLQGYMAAGALQRWLQEERLVSMALLRVDKRESRQVRERLKAFPLVAEVLAKQSVLTRFREQSANMIRVTSAIVTLFAMVITMGVVYNNARVALSMRGRDLATLRVLGFTRGEISSILLGELAVHVMLAIPLGLWFGLGLVHALSTTIDPETWRLPVVLSARTYAYAAAVTLGSAVLSALWVRRRLDHLDLIGVLKTQER